MAQEAYVGIDGISRNVTDIYVGVNDVARKVVKGYVGVDGVARQFWGDGGYSNASLSWHIWSSNVESIIIKPNPPSTSPPEENVGIVGIYKTNLKIAYYAIIKNSDNTAYLPIILSPDRDAVSFRFIYRRLIPNSHYYYETYYGDTTYSSWFTFVDNRGVTWYGSGLNVTFNIVGYMDLSDFILTDDLYEGSSREDAIKLSKYMVHRIYAIPFHEHYSVGQTYNTYLWDVNRTPTIRDLTLKTVGLFLLLNIHLYENNTYDPNGVYKYFSDGVRTAYGPNYHFSDPSGISNYAWVSVSYYTTSKQIVSITLWSGNINESESCDISLSQITSYNICDIFKSYNLNSHYPDTQRVYNVRMSSAEVRDGRVRWQLGGGTSGGYQYSIGLQLPTDYTNTSPYLSYLRLLSDDIELTNWRVN